MINYSLHHPRPSWLLALTTATLLVVGCGFDPTSAEYDRLRYDELQKVDCANMANLGMRRIFKSKDSNETYDSILQRCRHMQAMSFDDYRAASQKAREEGKFEQPPPAAAQQ